MSASLLRWRALVFAPVATLALLAVACDRPDAITGLRREPVFATSSPAAFQATGSLAAGRSAHVAVRLADGRVLVAGGVQDDDARLASAELFDPAAGSWSPTGNMTSPRLGHVAVLLGNGKVLVAGGASVAACTDPAVAMSAEVYDPATGSWSPTGNMQVARISPAIGLLGDGKVLVAGGGDRCGVAMTSAEVYDPASGTWALTGSLATARQGAGAVRLGDGRVLVAGGMVSFASLATAELYDPANGTWSSTGSMNSPRLWTSVDMSASHALALLSDGRVLTVGGNDQRSPFMFEVLNTAELYDAAAGTWTLATGWMARSRVEHQATVLADGLVLVNGGRDNDPLNTAELFDPAAGTFQSAPPLASARYQHSATLLADGRVLVVGGRDAATLSSAEIFGASQVNRAPVANAGVPGVGSEGTAVTFDGGTSSDPDGDALTYSWDFGDGSLPSSGARVSHTYVDNGVYMVTLSVSDGKVASTATTGATIANVAPRVGAFAGATLTAGGTYLATGAFSDPGADVWTATVDYGDGSGVQALALFGTRFSLSHVYAAAGTRVVTVTLRDDDGGVGAAQATVVVQQKQQNRCEDRRYRRSGWWRNWWSWFRWSRCHDDDDRDHHHGHGYN
jgi:PKD domain-containing protein/galactose oxidase-like protein/Kelch motif protein